MKKRQARKLVAAGGPEVVPKLIERYRNGESLRTLGKEFGVHNMTIYRWILAGVGDKEHAEVVTDCLVRRIADADEGLEGAEDAVQIAKYRELAKFARMDFERRRPALYGLRQTRVGLHSKGVRTARLDPFEP